MRFSRGDAFIGHHSLAARHHLSLSATMASIDKTRPSKRRGSSFGLLGTLSIEVILRHHQAGQKTSASKL
jgi:hypothetical protein